MKPSVTLSDSRIAWTERGQGDPVLLLHPMLMTGSVFDGVAGRLAQHDYRVVAPDLPGHGESDSPPERIDLDAMAATMAEFIAARSLERCHIVGVSMGGMVALRMAVRWPGLVRSMILMGASAGAERVWSRRRWLAVAKIGALLGPRAIAGSIARRLVGEGTQDSPRGPMVMSMVKAAIRGNPRQRILPLVRAVTERNPVGIEARRGIECPVLAIVGREDRVRSMQETREMAAPIQGSAIVELPLCGHLPMLEHPAPTVTLVLRFLDAAQRHCRPIPQVRVTDDTTVFTR